MSLLPTQCPKWYQPSEDDPTKGWTPKTSDIIDRRENHEIVNAWNGTYYPDHSHKSTVDLDRIKILSPIQVGGGSFPEGGILPAQIGGVPVIPGSSLRGSFLHYLRSNWPQFELSEQQFWLSLTNQNLTAWQPRKIRFSNILLKNLKAFPLNAQQKWQVFNERSKQLGIQWQVQPKEPINHPSALRFRLQVTLKDTPTPEQKNWLKARLETMLKFQGIGRGTHSGFGRLADNTPFGTWEIQLTGMKPCIQAQDNQHHINGKYRWSPQVLRAHLRSYFTRLCLSLMARNDAERLTEIIFGGFGHISQLTLTSYFTMMGRQGAGGSGYVNIPASEAHSIWTIQVDCNQEFKTLIGKMLELTSRLGGLGPGWRRPPHKLERFGGFRGSQFTVKTDYHGQSLGDLITQLQQEIQNLAQRFNITIPPTPPPNPGRIISIWQGKSDQWDDIVHGVCSTKATNRPQWCGNSNLRPSGYSVREHSDYCLITVFDSPVETILENQGFSRIF